MTHNHLEDLTWKAIKRPPTHLMAFALVAAFLFSGCATASKQAVAGKFYHVGLVWLKEPGNAEHRQKIIAAAHSFGRKFPKWNSSRSASRRPQPVLTWMIPSTSALSCGYRTRRRWIAMENTPSMRRPPRKCSSRSPGRFCFTILYPNNFRLHDYENIHHHLRRERIRG
jgi:hypothetical protein